MLVKLTTSVNFINMLLTPVFLRKYFANCAAFICLQFGFVILGKVGNFDYGNFDIKKFNTEILISPPI